MNVYIALFRGINVGGKNSLPMKDLIGILDEMGFVEINTYIQSGNVVFRSSKKCSSNTATQVNQKIMAQHGFEPEVLLLRETELRLAVKNNPFSTDEAKALHFYFLGAIPGSPDLVKLKGLKSDSEEFALVGTCSIYMRLMVSVVPDWQLFLLPMVVRSINLSCKSSAIFRACPVLACRSSGR